MAFPIPLQTTYPCAGPAVTSQLAFTACASNWTCVCESSSSEFGALLARACATAPEAVAAFSDYCVQLEQTLAFTASGPMISSTTSSTTGPTTYTNSTTNSMTSLSPSLTSTLTPSSTTTTTAARRNPFGKADE
jgi:hypothetical protein